MAVGTNGDIAWGFTNSAGDWSDLVVIEPVPGDPTKYQTPDGPRAFELVTEIDRGQGRRAGALRGALHDLGTGRGARSPGPRARKQMGGARSRGARHRSGAHRARARRSTKRCRPPWARRWRRRISSWAIASGRIALDDLRRHSAPRRLHRRRPHVVGRRHAPLGRLSRLRRTSARRRSARWPVVDGECAHRRWRDAREDRRRRLHRRHPRVDDPRPAEDARQGRRARSLRHAARRPLVVPRPLARRVPADARRADGARGASPPARAEAARSCETRGPDAPRPIPPAIASCAPSGSPSREWRWRRSPRGAGRRPTSNTRTIRRLEGPGVAPRERAAGASARPALRDVGRVSARRRRSGDWPARHGRATGRPHLGRSRTPPTSRIRSRPPCRNWRAG